MKSVDKVIEMIDWQLLNKQRLALVNIMSYCDGLLSVEEFEHLNGIINLLDELCDAKGVS